MSDRNDLERRAHAAKELILNRGKRQGELETLVSRLSSDMGRLRAENQRLMAIGNQSEGDLKEAAAVVEQLRSANDHVVSLLAAFVMQVEQHLGPKAA